ncbi:MAG: class I SAM-dependent methyltransferase [Pyrinomonadaceae bacterium]
MNSFPEREMVNRAIEDKISEFVKFLELIEALPIDQFYEEFQAKLAYINELSIQTAGSRSSLMTDFFAMTAPFFDLSEVVSRGRNKPLGYAGDYMTIDQIYEQKCNSPGLGARWDELFHSFDAPKAVRNRKTYFIETIHGLVADGQRNISILDLASGPCRDIAECLEQLNGNAERLDFHCVDIDREAIKYAEKMVEPYAGNTRILFERQNIFRFKSSCKYDLVWSGGLFDYLEDATAVDVIKRMWDCTNDNGKVIVGNFHPSNTSRNYMEWCGQWFLIHRSDEELKNLFIKAGIPSSSVSIEREPIGACIFGIATRHQK